MRIGPVRETLKHPRHNVEYQKRIGLYWQTHTVTTATAGVTARTVSLSSFMQHCYKPDRHVAHLELLSVDAASWAIVTLHNDYSVSKGVQLASCSQACINTYTHNLTPECQAPVFAVLR